jgi:1-acyl-sn-glycerol-3-phosphate acyltransferase
VSRAGRVRACRRLAAFAAITGAEIVRARLERQDAAGDLDRAVRSSARLARNVMPALGIEVEVRGRTPCELAVVVSNHRSYVDVPVVAAAAPGILLAKAEVASWPLIGEAARIGGTVFVRRDDRESRRRALDELAGVLRRGYGVTVFPEDDFRRARRSAVS